MTTLTKNVVLIPMFETISKYSGIFAKFKSFKIWIFSLSRIRTWSLGFYFDIFEINFDLNEFLKNFKFGSKNAILAMKLLKID